MSKLLIKEPPLQVLPSLAVAIGLNEAIIVQQLHYWAENKNTGVERDGYEWIFNTYEEWKVNFPFWSIATIQRAFLNLEKMGVIVAAQLDAKKRDMKKYYRIDYDVLCAMEDIKMMPSNKSKSDDVKGTTEITTETTKDDDEAAKPENNLSLISNLYESNIGAITPLLSEEFPEYADTFPADWIKKAFKIAVSNNARRWVYVKSCLNNMKKYGVDWTPTPQKKQPTPRQSLLEFQDKLLQWAAQGAD